MPDASVVIPARNAAATLGAQLAALAEQDHTGAWEVVVVDDASSDDTSGVARSWADRVGTLRVIRLEQPGGGARAMNAGAAVARGDVLLFADADDVVSTNWVSALASTVEPRTFATVGSEYERLNGIRRPLHPLDADHWPWHATGWLPFANGCSLGVHRSAFEAVGGYDETFPYGQDVDLSWRLQLAGCRLALAPDAVVHYRLRPTARQVFRQHVNYGRYQARLYRRYRTQGMPRTPWGHVLFDTRQALRLLRAPEPCRSQGAQLAGVRVGRALGSVRFAVLFP